MFYLSVMASTASPFELQNSNPRCCQSISHSISPAAEPNKPPQNSRISSTPIASDTIHTSSRNSPSRRRCPSRAADDVLPIGLLENASVAGQHWDSTLSSHTLQRSVSCATRTQSSIMAVDKVQRWSGMTRTVSDWDGLRRVCTHPNDPSWISH